MNEPVTQEMVEAEADEIARAAQAEVVRRRNELKKRQAAAKRAESRRSIETRQARERPSLTKDNSKKKKQRKKSRRGSARIKKQAPGRKALKKRRPKEEIKIDQQRKTTHNDVVRLLKVQPPITHADVRRAFTLYLGDRMADPDVKPEDWLDWIESETLRLKEVLCRQGLYPRDE